MSGPVQQASVEQLAGDLALAAVYLTRNATTAPPVTIAIYGLAVTITGEDDGAVVVSSSEDAAHRTPEELGDMAAFLRGVSRAMRPSIGARFGQSGDIQEYKP